MEARRPRIETLSTSMCRVWGDEGKLARVTEKALIKVRRPLREKVVSLRPSKKRLSREVS